MLDEPSTDHSNDAGPAQEEAEAYRAFKNDRRRYEEKVKEQVGLLA